MHPHFIHEDFVFGSSHLAGEVVAVSFLLEKLNLLGESMYLEVLKPNPWYLSGNVLHSLPMFMFTLSSDSIL
jgi:hypothetical protein